VFINAHDSSLVGWTRAQEAGVELRPQHGRIDATLRSRQRQRPGPYFNFTAPLKDETGRTVANLPCWRPPWAHLVAVNANTGDVVWEVPLGLSEALPEAKRLTGNSGSAGPSVTAGGLVFVGATSTGGCVRSTRRRGRSCGPRVAAAGQREPDDLPRQEREAVRGGGLPRIPWWRSRSHRRTYVVSGFSRTAQAGLKTRLYVRRVRSVRL
jgi:hypothetical protein